MLKVDCLQKFFGSHQVLNDVSFHIPRGTIFAFFGENGAGKSTTMNIIATLISQTSGKFSVNNSQVKKDIRKEIGIVFQEILLDGELSVYENLLIRGMLYADKITIIKRIHQLLDEFQLLHLKDKKVEILSGGQKRMIQIIRALLGNPKLLILDEPTVGLDPQMRARVWEVLVYLKNQYQMSILFSSHYMEEAKICDAIGIIDKGKMKLITTPDELLKNYSNYHVSIETSSGHTQKSFSLAKDAHQYLKKEKNIYSFECRKDTLDDIFQRIIQRGSIPL